MSEKTNLRPEKADSAAAPLSRHQEQARALFLGDFNCAQAVFAAFNDVTGLDAETAMKLSSSFGGGMGRMREVCGAVSAMFMVAGLLYGYSDPADAEAKAAHYALIQQLAAQFREQHGTILCRDLLAAVETDASPNPTPRTDDYYQTRPCLKFVEDAAGLIDRLIAEKSAAADAAKAR